MSMVLFCTGSRCPVGLGLLLVMLPCAALAQPPEGALQGVVEDAERGVPLAGALVEVHGGEPRSRTDAHGFFTMAPVAVGVHAVTVSRPDYVPQVLSDVVIQSDRSTVIKVRLAAQPRFHEDVVVEPDFFPRATEDQGTSAVSFSHEEIRRAAGTAGDITKFLAALPSVAKVNTMMNHLVVRGGSPIENTSYIDGVEVPNINHYPIQGSASGFSPIGLVNLAFVDEVTFQPGAFPADFGGVLSSVMDIRFRDGSADRKQFQAELGIAGLGGSGEGPLQGGKGSWLFSARRSYLGPLLDLAGATDVRPRYADAQGKAGFQLSDRHHLSFLGIGGDDRFELGRERAFANFFFGTFATRELAGGTTWRALWSEDALTETSLGYARTTHTTRFSDDLTEELRLDAHDRDDFATLRSKTSIRHSPQRSSSFGLEARRSSNRFGYSVRQYVDYTGAAVPETSKESNSASWRFALFGSQVVKPTPKLALSLGVRFEHSTYNHESHVEPRIGLRYEVRPNTSLKGSFGIVHQSPPLTLVSRAAEFRELADLVAYHAVVGLDQRLGGSVRLTLEAYAKEYNRFPVDPDRPQYFVVDELTNGLLLLHDRLQASGRARSFGVEALLQKKLARNFYGLASVAFFRSRYRAADGVWCDRFYDNRYLASAQGGYRPNDRWHASVQWLFAGGTPYTPFDLERSTSEGADWFGILDEKAVNRERNPPLLTLSARLDRRFYWRSRTLTTFASVSNVLNRKHVSLRYWDRIALEPSIFYDIGLLPMVGFELAF